MTAPRRFVLGMDVGGTKLRAAIAGLDGEPLAETVTATAAGDPASFVAQVGATLEELARRVGATAAARAVRVPGDDAATGAARAADLPGVRAAGALGVGAAGVALPLSIQPGTAIHTSFHNVPGLAGLDLCAELEAALGMPVALDNDANLAALAEGRRGAAIGYRDYAVLAIGTGIGMGIVAGGTLVRGAHGAAGDVGFLPLGANPRDPQSVRRGSFEIAAAGPALRARIDDAIGRNSRTTLQPGAMLEDVVDAAGAGDVTAGHILDEEASLVALGIAAIVAVLDPALVLLTGGIGSVPGLLEPVRRHAAALIARPPDIRTGTLGHRAPLIGAIEAALDLARGA